MKDGDIIPVPETGGVIGRATLFRGDVPRDLVRAPEVRPGQRQRGATKSRRREEPGP